MTTPHRTIRFIALLGLLALSVLPLSAANDPLPGDLVGSWHGTLQVGDVQLRLVFHVDRSDDGKLTATLDSPDQGATGIPVAAVTLEEDAVRFDVASIRAEYAGQLTEEGAAIEGEWRQSGQVFPLTVERRKEAAEASEGG